MFVLKSYIVESAFAANLADVTELSAKSTVTIVPLATATLVTALAAIESTVILFNGIFTL